METIILTCMAMNETRICYFEYYGTEHIIGNICSNLAVSESLNGDFGRFLEDTIESTSLRKLQAWL